jgi:hypothetical protein
MGLRSPERCLVFKKYWLTWYVIGRSVNNGIFNQKYEINNKGKYGKTCK